MNAEFMRSQYPDDVVGARQAAAPLKLSPILNGNGGHPELTLLVAGCRGGKTSFLRLLLDTTTISPSASPEQLASVAKFVQGCSGHTSHIRATSVDVLTDTAGGPHTSLTLTVVDTPSFDHRDDETSERLVSETMRHIEGRFLEGVEDPPKVRNGDHYVHLCVYFLDPDKIVPPAAPAPPAPVIQRPRTSSFSQAEQDPVILEPPVTNNPLLFRPNLPAADIATIRRLSARVNVLPVISRADLLSNERLSAIKLAVRRDLADSGIGFGIFDLDNNANNNYRPDEPPTELTNGHHAPNGVPLSSRSGSPVPPSLLRLPYALISPDMYSHSDGVPKIQPSRHDLVLQYTPSYKASSSKLVRGKFIRSYRWGFLDVLDVNHSDFVPLRTAIFHHMETLQQYTRDYLFAKFKDDCLVQQRPDSRHSISHLTQGMPHVVPPSAPVSRPTLSIETTSPLTLPRPAPESLFRGPRDTDTMRPPSRPVGHEHAEQKSSGSRSSRQRGRKIPVACNFCRSRKLRCDGGRPACSQCIKRSNPCDYQGRRRRNGRGARRGEDESESEGSVDDRSPSLSPTTSTRPISQRNSVIDRHDPGAYPPSLPSFGVPPDSSSSRSRQQLPISHPHSFVDNDLPRISTLALPNPSPATPASAPFPPIRTQNDEQQQPSQSQGAPTQRKRASTVPGKNTRLPTTSGPKVVACNFCRARKTKCDGMIPACSSCSRRQLHCNYVNQERTAAHGARKGMRRASAATSTGKPPRNEEPMSSASPASSRMIPTPSDTYPSNYATDIDTLDNRPTKKIRLSPMGLNMT